MSLIVEIFILSMFVIGVLTFILFLEILIILSVKKIKKHVKNNTKRKRTDIIDIYHGDREEE